MELHIIDTGFFKLDGGAMFGTVPKSIWNRLNPADDNNMCNWAMRCLLVVDGNRRILIDTGIGDKQSEKFYSYYYLNGADTLTSSLNTAGFEKSDITDVLLTHLHFDHCGGAVQWNKNRTGYEPAFPNATYHLSEAHFAHAQNSNMREKASFLPENYMPLQEAGVLNFVKNGEMLAPGIGIIIVNGHTVEMCCPMIRHNDHTIFYAADLFPSSAHIPVNYVMGYDIEPLVTMETRAAINARAVEENWILYFEHDRAIPMARVQVNEKGQYSAGEILTTIP